MNKKATNSLLLITASLFLGGCTLFKPPISVSPNNPTPTEESFTGSLKDLIAKGKSMQCQWNTDDSESKTQSSGMMYMDGKKFRQQITSKFNNPAISDTDTNVVSNGQDMYMWDNKTKQGVKLSLDQATANEVSSQPTESQNVNLNKNYEFKCKPWSADQSQFNIPDDIIFSDLGQMMKNLQNKINSLPTGIPSGIPNIPNLPGAENQGE